MGKKIVTFVGKERIMTAQEVGDESMDASASNHAFLRGIGHEGLTGAQVIRVAGHEASHQKPLEKYKPDTQVIGFVGTDDEGYPNTAGVVLMHVAAGVPLGAKIKSLLQPMLDGDPLSGEDVRELKKTVKNSLGLNRIF